MMRDHDIQQLQAEVEQLRQQVRQLLRQKSLARVHTATAGGNAINIKTPAGGIPACTGTGTAGDPFVWGSAVCDLIDPETGAPYIPNRTERIYNEVNVAIGGSVAGKAEKVGKKYFIDVAGCPGAYV